jgi:hypothetical protein
MKGALLAACLLLAACGGGASGASQSPTHTNGSLSSASPAGSSPAAPSASASPTTLSSARGFITVSRPAANARVTSPLTISGDASVFEATLQWRVTDSAGRVLAQGVTTATAGAPARGTYAVIATFTPPSRDTIGIVEVYERSPRDGSIDEIVRVPVVITP